MPVLKRNNVRVVGTGKQTMIFSHGYGCDQSMWRFVAPAFENGYRIVLFDHVGSGQSDLTAYDRVKYGTLHGYADDMLEICDAVDADDAILVGHSVGAMISLLAAIKAPKRISKVVLVSPSPCFINDEPYIGGFNRQDIDELLDFLDSNYLGWTSMVTPLIMGNPDRPELTEELANSFCRTDPDIAQHFARVTFTADHRDDLPSARTPALILQSVEDAIAPVCVGEYMHGKMDGSRLVIMQATGHCPHLSAPDETITAMRAFL